MSKGEAVCAFAVEGIPRAQGSMVALGKGRMRHASRALKPWRADVAKRARIAMRLTGNAMPRRGDITLTVLFTLPRPRSVPVRKRPRPRVRPDLDKLLRAALDALQGVAFYDDAQVVRIACAKRYDDDADATVGVRIAVEELYADRIT